MISVLLFKLTTLIQGSSQGLRHWHCETNRSAGELRYVPGIRHSWRRNWWTGFAISPVPGTEIGLQRHSNYAIRSGKMATNLRCLTHRA